jgi:hypothetical protein
LSISDCRFPIYFFLSRRPAIDSINRQSAIGNRKSFSEWLADPGCSPINQESNADLETMAAYHHRPKPNQSTGLLLATSSTFRVPVESPLHPLPGRHFDPIGTEFL